MISCSALLHKAANLHLRFEKKRLDDQHSAGTGPNVSVNISEKKRSTTTAIPWHMYLKPRWFLKELP